MGEQESGHRVWRSRWAAIGAAIAVSLGAGGVFFAEAASPPSSVVMVAPARILDTRDPVNVGLNGPFVSAIGQDLQVTGLIATTTGPATIVPTGATGVILNVTVVGPAASGFLSVRPADAPGAPTTSNLNFLAGELVPNAVSVELPTAGPEAGRIEITYDAYGVAGPTTDVLIDVVGYTVGAASGDSGQVAALQAQVSALEARVAMIEATAANSKASYIVATQQVALTSGTDVVVRSVTIVPTANGKVITNASGTMYRLTLPFIPRCSITTGSNVDETTGQLMSISAGGLNDAFPFAITRGFDVAKGVAVTVRLVCDRSVGTGAISAASLTAVFAPN